MAWTNRVVLERGGGGVSDTTIHSDLHPRVSYKQRKRDFSMLIVLSPFNCLCITFTLLNFNQCQSDNGRMVVNTKVHSGNLGKDLMGHFWKGMGQIFRALLS